MKDINFEKVPTSIINLKNIYLFILNTIKEQRILGIKQLT
jgi:hypothetical protein